MVHVPETVSSAEVEHHRLGLDAIVAKAISTGTSGSTSRNAGKTMFPLPGTVFPVTDQVDPPLQPSISAAHDSDAASSDTEYLPAKRGRGCASHGRGHGQVDDQTSAMAGRGRPLKGAM